MKQKGNMLSGNTLSTLMKRVIDSDYDSVEGLVAASSSYSIGELRGLLDNIIAVWEANELTPAAMYVLLKFVDVYLEQPEIQIDYKNRTPIPLCYFSSYLPMSASLLLSYLRTLSLAVMLFRLDETDYNLRRFIEKEGPPAVLFTVPHFLYLQPLRQLVPYLHDNNIEVFIGGIPFVCDGSLKQAFPGCIFPHDLAELSLLLIKSLKVKTKWKV